MLGTNELFIPYKSHFPVCSVALDSPLKRAWTTLPVSVPSRNSCAMSFTHLLTPKDKGIAKSMGV